MKGERRPGDTKAADFSAVVGTTDAQSLSDGDVPAVSVAARRVRPRTGRDWYWLLTYRCESCGRTHRHGGGPVVDGEPPDGGLRVAHCPRTAANPEGRPVRLVVAEVIE